MKKIVIISVLSVFIFSACKRQQDNPSTVVTASYPKITMTEKYYSIPVGAVRPTVLATAYDTFYKVSVPIVTIDSAIHNFVPGLYEGTISATNQYGYSSYANYWVAVTGVSTALTSGIAGTWIQPALSDSFSTTITMLANGLFSSSNVNGVNIYTNPTGVVSDIFALTSNTTLEFSSGTTGTLTYIPVAGDTSMTYSTPTGSVTFNR